MKIQNEQKDWICERIETSHTGRIRIKQNLVEKYRNIIGDYHSPNWKIRDMMIREFAGKI